MIKKWKQSKIEQLFDENIDAIRKYNVNFCPKLALIGIIISVFAVLGSFLNPHLQSARFMYSFCGIVCVAIYVIMNIESMAKYALIWIYSEFFMLYLLVLYLSVVVAPDRAAASMLIVLTIFPITFIDRPIRLLGTNILMFLIHSIAAYIIKGEYLGNLDLVNCLIATMVGCFCGMFVLEAKLLNFNLARLLAYEKETDILTTLGNRRKLVQTICAMEAGERERANGLMMFDIDHFKQYNDRFGHQAGDQCLRAFGKMLRGTEWGAEIAFYRYGGEEFVALVWNATEEKMADVAESIRKTTEKISLAHDSITTSIGYVFCEKIEKQSYEKWLGCADEAVYQAKNEGRNCVVEYQPEK